MELVSLRSDLETRSWASFSAQEKTAWLYLNILNLDVQDIDGQLVVADGTVIQGQPNASIVYQCEQAIIGTEYEEYYIGACVIEISNITYNGMTPAEIAHPATAKKYYRNAILLPVALKAKSLFWAKRKTVVV